MARKRYLMCVHCDPVVFHDDLGALNTHLERRHNTLSSVKCGLCKKLFMHRTSLIRHIKDHIKKCEDEEEHEDENESAGGLHSLAGPSSTAADRQESSVFEGSGDNDEDNASQGAPEQPVGEEVPDFKTLAAMFLLKLRSSGNLTNTSVTMIQDFVAELLNNVVKNVEHCTSKFISESLGVGKEETSEFFSGPTFQIKNPFEDLKTVEDQLQFFSEKFGMAIPVEKMLGSRIENRFDRTTRTFLPTTVLETFQSISLIETLTLIVRNAYLRNLILSEEQSTDGVYRNYKDGTDFKSNPFLQKYPYTIRIILYYDDLEISNALGSKDTIHRLGCFYISIQNLPPEESSLLSSIFLLALTYAEDLKKPGVLEKVLLPFISDLNRLQSENGVEIDLPDGGKFILRACLVCLCADALAAHALLGLLSPSANLFCRLCLVTKKNIMEDSSFVGVLRTARLHEKHVQEVEQQQALPRKYGVKERSPLADVMRVPEDSVFDAFHDLVGVVQMVLKLALYEYVCVKKFFKITEFNSSLNMFVYGAPDAKNKPSPNILTSKLCGSDHALKQYGSQTFCLLRVFPFLLKNVPDNDDILQLVFLLQDIVKIIFSFEITDLNIVELENLIYRHNQMFHDLFVTFNDNDSNVEAVDESNFEIEEEEEDNIGDENTDDNEHDQGDQGRRQIQRRRKKLKKGINKLHHLLHYPQQMREKGPMIRLWCARFEGRHRIIRKHSGVQSNFKNPPKTMARMFQLSTLGSVVSRTGPRENVISGGEKLSLESTPYCAKLLEAGFLANSQVILAKSVEVSGEDYSVGLFVNLKDETTAIPSFAIILDIVVKSDKSDEVFLAVSKCKNNGLSPRYNSYHISNDFEKDTTIVKIANLAHHRAIAPWTPVNDKENNLYLHPRTI